MKPTYSDAGKLAWYPDIACPVCGGDVNSWDKRCSRALGYRQIVLTEEEPFNNGSQTG